MSNRVTTFFRTTFRDRFKRYLIISLIVVGIVAGFTSRGMSDIGDINFFYLPGCSHCEEQEPFNKKLEAKYSINITRHDCTVPQAYSLLSQMLAERGVEDEPAFPITIFGNQVFGGWESEQTTGRAIEEALQQCLAGNCPEPAGDTGGDNGGEVNLPIIGKIDPAGYSLLGLAVVLGLVDGFNPCAMWVLVYLISLVATLRDRRRIWLIVGSFVLASGILYFVFMAAQLTGFQLVGRLLGYVKPVTIVIGLVALGGGILQMKEFVQTKGAIVCKVTDQDSRAKTMTRAQKIVSSPITLGTIVGIIALAFVVNSVEFACSWVVPTTFTGALSQASLTTFQRYAYILVYDVFFMIDDTIIFGTAALAASSSLGERYARYTRPVGGTILIVLGMLLLVCLYAARFAFLQPLCSVLR